LNQLFPADSERLNDRAWEDQANILIKECFCGHPLQKRSFGDHSQQLTCEICCQDHLEKMNEYWVCERDDCAFYLCINCRYR